MQLKIKSLHLIDFKGVKDQVYKFEDITKILAANGLGKTTIATAWYWLTTDKDYALKSNPNIRPIGVEECIPRVDAILDIDGKEITISKQQKTTKSKPDAKGVIKTATANMYEINSVPKAERDFREYLENNGIDWDLFLALCHPNVFTGQKASDMRRILFKMASEKSDLNIANMEKDTYDIAELLRQGYELDEIEKMNKSSKVKAEKQVSAIPNQIIGMEKSKVDIDIAELELEKSRLNEQISAKKKLLDDNQSILDEYQKVADSAMELKFKMNEIIQEAQRKLAEERSFIQDKVNSADKYFKDSMQKQKMVELDIGRINDSISRKDSERIGLGKQYKEKSGEQFDSSKWVFNENSTACPLCGREYDAEKIEEERAKFEARKTKAIESFEQEKKALMDEMINLGNQLKREAEEMNAQLDNLQVELAQIKAGKINANKAKTMAMEELSSLPERADLSDNQEYEAMQLELSNLEKSLESMNNGATYRNSLKNELEALQGELSEVEKQIAVAGRNVDIDEQISELQEKQRDYEQAKADAEKILYQLDLLSKRKNELLVEDINSHFRVVRWMLFDYQKNGGYKEVCIPVIDGKRFGDSTNTGREIIGKLDICNSLQEFFGISLPVFLDGAESINGEYVPDMDCQLILLKVTEDKELKVEGA